MSRFSPVQALNLFDENFELKKSHEDFVRKNLIILDVKNGEIEVLKKEYQSLNLMYEYSFFDWMVTTELVRLGAMSRYLILSVTKLQHAYKYCRGASYRWKITKLYRDLKRSVMR